MQLPAFGRELLNLRVQGQRPVEWVLVTDGWSVAKLHRVAGWPVLVLHKPHWRYDWTPVQGLEVLVMPWRVLDDERAWTAQIRAIRQEAASVRRVTLEEALVYGRDMVAALQGRALAEVAA